MFKGTVVLNAQCVREHSGALALLVYESELKGTLFLRADVSLTFTQMRKMLGLMEIPLESNLMTAFLIGKKKCHSSVL